jgi:hypothetical protein
MVWGKDKQLQGGKYTIEEVRRQGRFSITYLARNSQGNLVIISNHHHNQQAHQHQTNLNLGASQFLLLGKRIISSLRSLRTEGWRYDVLRNGEASYALRVPEG